MQDMNGSYRMSKKVRFLLQERLSEFNKSLKMLNKTNNNIR